MGSQYKLTLTINNLDYVLFLDDNLSPNPVILFSQSRPPSGVILIYFVTFT